MILYYNKNMDDKEQKIRDMHYYSANTIKQELPKATSYNKKEYATIQETRAKKMSIAKKCMIAGFIIAAISLIISITIGVHMTPICHAHPGKFCGSEMITPYPLFAIGFTMAAIGMDRWIKLSKQIKSNQQTGFIADDNATKTVLQKIFISLSWVAIVILLLIASFFVFFAVSAFSSYLVSSLLGYY